MPIAYVRNKKDLPPDSDFECSICLSEINIDEITNGQPNCVICENGHRLHLKCYNKQIKTINEQEMEEYGAIYGHKILKCPLCKIDISHTRFCKSYQEGYSYRPSKGGKSGKKKKTYKKRKMCKKRKIKHNRSLNYKGVNNNIIIFYINI
jgi:hypothetical protein